MNLREQPKLWDSQRERGPKKKKREKERENYPTKSPNLRHCQARSQNKGLSEYQRGASRLRTSPFPLETGRQEQPDQAGAISAPERHPLPNCKQTPLLTKTSWDSGWLTSAGRIAVRDPLPRRGTGHI